MPRKLGQMLINNFSLKILAILSAVILWIVVVNIDDPIKSLTYTTSVTVVNSDYITSQGKYFEVLDSNNTISFQVSAKRSILERIVSSDFSATADMEKIEYDERNDIYRIPVSVTCSKYSSHDVTISTKQLYKQVALEDLGSIQKTISADTKGTVADGCALGDVKVVGSNLLKISGPSSLVSQIDFARATINVEGVSTDVTDSVVPVLYDEQENVVDTTRLTLSINTVTVQAQILNTKDVTVELKNESEAADGYIVTGVEYSPDEVRIKGEAAILNPINKITIPSDVLDLSGATENVATTIDISAYLPAGTSLVLSSDAIVNVTAKIEPVVKKTFEIPVTNLTVTGLAEGYHIRYPVSGMTVELAGASEEIGALAANDIMGTIDLSELTEGVFFFSIIRSPGFPPVWQNRLSPQKAKFISKSF